MKIFVSAWILPLALLAQSVGTLVPAGRMAKARTNHTATLLADGKVLFTGGKCDSSCEKSIELYDPETGLSTEAGALLYGRSDHAAVLLADGRVLISGGAAVAEIFDPISATSQPFPTPIPSGIKQSAFRLADGRAVFACGGGSIEIVDVAKAEVEHVNAGGFGCRAAAALPDGRLLVSNSSLSHSAYNPATKEWEFLQAGNWAFDDYEAFTANSLPNGKVAIAGGISTWWFYRDSMHLYDIVSVSAGLTQSETLAATRYSHAACLSPDGLLLSGGSSGSTFTQPGLALFQSTPLASMEIRELDSGRFSASLRMNSARTGHTCTLLNDGSVLLSGGRENSTMERYIPAKAWPSLSIAAAFLVRNEALELYVDGLLESSPHPPQVSINGQPAELLYFAPGQINVRIPKNSPLRVQFTYLGRHSNTLSVAAP